MSDFLTNLAARALHVTPVVQPRVASRFEASQASQRFLSDDTPGTEAELFYESVVPTAPPATIAHSEPHDRARARRNDSDTSPLRSLPSLEQPVADSIHRALTPRETHAENTSPIRTGAPIGVPPWGMLPASEPTLAASATTVISAPVLTSLSALEQPVAKELPRGLSPGESHIATASPIVVKTVIDRQAIRDAFGMESRPVPVSPLRSEPPSHLATKIRTSGPLVAIQRLTPVPAPSPTPSQNPDRPAALPTIRVTIGRVEVRAILPPAPAPPRATPARASSLLSLDEYLKRRTEGRT